MTIVIVSEMLCTGTYGRDADNNNNNNHHRNNKYIGPSYCRAEIYAGCVACSPWRVTVTMPTGQTDGQTDGRTPDRYITLSARRRQRNNTNNSNN